MSKFSRFDLILIIDLAIAVLLITQESWMRVNGFGDLPSGMWTFAGLIFGGEILSFSLYQMVKEVNGGKASKSFLAKHSNIKDVDEEIQNGRNTEQPRNTASNGFEAKPSNLS